MQDSYPPFVYLSQVLQHCPKAGLTYLKLWNSKNLNDEIIVEKNKIRELFQTTPTRLKNDLLDLSNEGVVSVNEFPSSLVIELTRWDFDCSEGPLC